VVKTGLEREREKTGVFSLWRKGIGKPEGFPKRSHDFMSGRAVKFSCHPDKKRPFIGRFLNSPF